MIDETSLPWIGEPFGSLVVVGAGALVVAGGDVLVVGVAFVVGLGFVFWFCFGGTCFGGAFLCGALFCRFGGLASLTANRTNSRTNSPNIIIFDFNIFALRQLFFQRCDL